MRSSDLVSVSTFRTRIEAQKAKSILDQAGIGSVIQPDPSRTFRALELIVELLE